MTQLLDAGSTPRSVSEERTTGIQGGPLGNMAITTSPYPQFNSLKLPENFGMAIDLNTGEFLNQIGPHQYEVSDIDRATSKYALRSAARELLKPYRKTSNEGKSLPVYKTVRCGLYLVSRGSGVGVLRSTEYGTAHFSNLCTCSNVWLCTVCASKISNRRHAELIQATQRNNESGGVNGLLTVTVPHARADRCAEVIERVQKLFSTLNSGKAAVNFKNRNSILGQVRALEFTHGFNGWHPHIHSLLFAEHPMCWEEAGDELYRRWSSSAKKHYGWELPRISLDLRGGERAASYVSKWGIEDEITKGLQKEGKSGSRSPWGLLSDYANGNTLAGKHWQEFATSVCKKTNSDRIISSRQLVWSRGLKGIYGIGEATDEEIAANQIEPAILLGTLTFDEWKKVIGQPFEARPVLLQIASIGTIEDVKTYVNSLPPVSK
ncbi:protein rep [Paraperlucidibaca wandonensis]|uniref:Protein rep n=1 Tax=Paraperlucidibaca wandonensis TaxID=1268273 RepID=A0ABW3HH98_9GAMM